MGRGLTWLLLAATSSTGTSGTSSTGDNSVGSDGGTSTSTASSSTTEDTTSSGGSTTSTTEDTDSDTDDPTGEEASTSICLSAPHDVSSCLSVVTDNCDCRHGPPSPAALLLALLVFGLRRRSRAEMIDALAVSERLPPDVVERLRVSARRP